MVGATVSWLDYNLTMNQAKAEELLSVTRHRFTVEEYHKMGEVDIFGEDDRVELIDGEVVRMTPVGLRHVRCVNRLTVLFVRFADAAGRFEVNVQNPINLGEYGEPLPDLALVKGPPVGRLPGPAEIALVVEVSDTTITYDRTVKLPLYASVGIPEAWIVNLNEDTVEVHADPSPEGYRSTSYFERGSQVVSATIPGLTLDAEKILPPQ